MKKHSLLAQSCVSPIALVVALAAGPAFAQQTAADSAAKGGLEEVIVTARKVAEKLQDVPVSVTAFNGEALKQQNAITLQDMSAITPGLTMRSGAGASSSEAFFSLRGQSQTSELATVDPSVGVYVDGVYWARAFGINTDLVDVSNVQTLKGPQGTLFGRNTTGGAVLINTNDPVLNKFSGELSGTLGRFDYRSARAIINAPIVDDRVALRVAYQIVDSDGYATDPNSPGKKQGNHSDYTFRTKLLTKLNDNLSVLLSANIYRERADVAPYELRFVPSTSSTIQNVAVASGQFSLAQCFGFAGAQAATDCAAAGTSIINSYIQSHSTPSNLVAQNAGQDLRSAIKTQTYDGTISYDTSFGNVKLIGGYRKVDPGDGFGDYDGSPFLIDGINNINNLEQWSLEGQVTGKALENRLSYAGGVFFFHEDGLNSTFFYAEPALSPTIIQYAGDINNKSVGVYGQATYAVTDRLNLTGGLRWSHDKKAVTINNGAGAGDYINGITPGTFTCSVGAGCPTYRTGSFSGVDYTAALDYKFDQDVMGYIKTAKGFRSGGVNLRETVLVPGQSGVPFKPEKDTSYEAGFKSEFWDRRVRVNVAEYYSIAKDIQRTAIVTCTSCIPSVSTTQAVNASRADFWGGEYEIEAKVLQTREDGVTLGFSAANVNPKYVDYKNPTTGFDQSHESFDTVPKWQFTISSTLTHDFEASTLTLHADYVWDSGYQMGPDNYYLDSAGVAHDATTGAAESLADAVGIHNALKSPASGVFNARAAIAFGQDLHYELAIYGRNIFNNRAFFSAGPVTALGLTGQRREPATYGVQATVNF